jgi:sulfur-oxidizing protein SoxZ
MAESTTRITARMRPDFADVRALVMHPMETGNRHDAKGQRVALHFIQRVQITHNGRLVLDAQWSQAIARDPFVGIRVRGAKPGDTVALEWVDNRGARERVETVVTA